jgi:hypothetical protein
MTPQEIFDYKFKWKSNAFGVPFHSDWETKYTDWCKSEFEKWEWDLIRWSNVYEHIMIFEKKDYADRFKAFIK